jgi:ribosomal-protein-alanine N-acetyltransferase
VTKTNEVRIDGEFSNEHQIAKLLVQEAASWAPPTLQTSRLILRAINESDAGNIYAYAQNPNVSRWTLWEPHRSVDDSLTYIRDYVFKHYREKTPEPFGIAWKDRPETLIGTVGCFWASRPAKSMELAYALSESYWGQGITTEASLAVMEHCFETYDLKRIQARCKVENVASARVMQKIGMEYEGTLRAMLFHRERYWDMAYYAKIRA